MRPIPIYLWKLFLPWLCLALCGCLSWGNKSLQRAAQSTLAAPISQNRACGGAFTPTRASTRPGYVQLSVSVYDGSNGHIVSGLTKKNFELSSDGRSVAISSVAYDANPPKSVGFVVDASGSMKPKMAQLRSAVRLILKRLNPRDDVALVGIAEKPYYLQTGTTNRTAIIGLVDALQAWGQTDLYDGIVSGVNCLARLCFPHKTLVVISDGFDNVSTARSLNVVNMAKTAGIKIDAIGIGDVFTSGILWWNQLFAKDAVDLPSLQSVSRPTGGQVFHVRMSDDEGSLETMAKDIAEGPGVYLLEFAKPSGAAPGGGMSVTIKGHPDYVVTPVAP